MKEAMRFMCDREIGGVLLPDDVEDKSGSYVRETLRNKHPEARNVELSDIPEFPGFPEF